MRPVGKLRLACATRRPMRSRPCPLRRDSRVTPPPPPSGSIHRRRAARYRQADFFGVKEFTPITDHS